MSAKKAANSAAPSAPAGGSSGKRAGAGRWVIGLLLLAGAGAGLWFVVWDHVKEHVLGGAEYRVEADKIEITSPPPWIHSDVKAEVVRNASLDNSLSVLDDQLTVRIAQAFTLHPWVARVTRVSKHHPAGVTVELIYRQPVAMVEVTGGLLPVDGDGVLLPSEDFASADAARFPRICEIKTVPIGPQGTRWGDARVGAGAKLAALLGDEWKTFKLARIVPTTPPAGVRSGDDISYEIYSQAGTRIIWGHAPGSERPGDPLAADKLERLRRYVATNGSLEGSSGPQVLDLRSGATWSSARARRSNR